MASQLQQPGFRKVQPSDEEKVTSKSPTRLNLRQQQGAESRTLILEAARKLMAERGFAGTSISAVSRRSGLPASSIYWHFGSKEGLLASVAQDGAERFLRGLPQQPPKGKTSGADRAQTALATAAAHLEADPEFLRFFMLIALERGTSDEASAGSIRRSRDLALFMMRRIVELTLEDADITLAPSAIDELTRFGVAAGEGGFLAHQINPDGVKLRRHFELIGLAIRALATQMDPKAH